MSINNYLNSIKEFAVEGAQIAASKTKQLASITKANMDIRVEQDAIKKAQTEIGKLYYKDFIVSELPDEAEYTPLCDQISKSRIIIEELKNFIEDTRSGINMDVGDDFVVEIIQDEDDPLDFSDNNDCDCGCSVDQPCDSDDAEKTYQRSHCCQVDTEEDTDDGV